MMDGPLCQVELDGHGVTGGTRTPNLPRHRRALYRLSYGHSRSGRDRTSDILPPKQARYHCATLRFARHRGIEPRPLDLESGSPARKRRMRWIASAPPRLPPACKAGALPVELKVHGADAGIRTRSLQHGKLAPYRWATSARSLHPDSNRGFSGYEPDGMAASLCSYQESYGATAGCQGGPDAGCQVVGFAA